MLFPAKYLPEISNIFQPKLGTILISYRCDNNCIFCAPAPKRSKGGILENKVVLDWINRYTQKELFLVSLSGAGDPLYNKNIFRYIEMLRDKGIVPYVYTNGQLITKSISKKLLQAGLSDILLSIHGPNNKIHDYHTSNEGSFFKAINSMQLLLDSGFYIQTNTVITRWNIDLLEEMIDLMMVRYHIHEMAFSYPEIRGNVHNCTEMIINYQAVRCPLEKAIMETIKFDKKLILDNLPLCLLGNRDYLTMPDVDIYYKDDFYDTVIKPSKNGRRYLDKCENCPEINKCIGIDINYPYDF